MTHIQPSSTTPENIPRFVFFGTSRLSVIVLKELHAAGINPVAIITSPDKPQGRKLVLTPTLTKSFGIAHNIEVLEFEKLNAEAIALLQQKFAHIEMFLVASYGLIIPQDILDIPSCGVINIHPSLLPQYRGATPIQQALLEDTFNTGITIMQMDAKMDHGPLLFQEKRKNIFDWPKKYNDLEEELAIQATQGLIHILPSIKNHHIIAVPQDHEKATFTKKIAKADGCIDITALAGKPGRENFLKYCAFDQWPSVFFMIKKHSQDIRVKITEAHWDNENSLMVIDKVIPEGQKEVAYSDFLERVQQYYS